MASLQKLTSQCIMRCRQDYDDYAAVKAGCLHL